MEDVLPVTSGAVSEEDSSGLIRGPAVVQVARRTLQPLGRQDRTSCVLRLRVGREGEERREKRREDKVRS